MENDVLTNFAQELAEIEASININPNKVIESSKGLLDSICKTILGDLGRECDSGWDSPKLIKETLNNLPFLKTILSRDARSAQKIMTSLTTLNQGICELRNNNPYVTHGKDMGADFCDSILAHLVFDSVKTVGMFLLELHSKFTRINEMTRVRYEDHKEFNSWYDEIYGDVAVGTFTFSASLTLYNNDIEAYKEAIQDYLETDKN